MRTKLGELIVASTPSPAPKPFANTVFPAPSSPHRHTTSPGRATSASRAARERVASGLVLTNRPTLSTAGAARLSGKALEIAERNRDRRPPAEAHECRLERHPRGEAPRSRETGPCPLGARERPRANANEVPGGRRQQDARVVDHETRRVADDRGHAALDR